jgi:exosortase E/protease (VPEID-CTERM system)
MISNALFEPTIYLMGHYFSWMDVTFVADTVSKTINVNSYTAALGPSCLGYKGMGILILLTGFYLYSFRKVLRFPRTFIIFPIICIILLLTNSLRMTLLLLIGAYISPEIASIGFHSAAGWINIFAIGFLALYSLTRLSFFTRQKSVFRIHLTDDTARLIPELVLISLSLLFLLFNNGFDWAYPLRIVLAGLVIKYLWKRLNIRFRPFDWKVLLIGIASLFIWILIVKNDLTKSHEFAGHLFSAQTWQTYIWMIFRILGASLVIPIAEELFFRGYMFDAIKHFLKDTPHKIRKNHIDILTLVITSILFGWLHSQWMAGFLAGLLFGLARLYRHRISDAIIAHAATNFLLAVYVVYFEAWSLW